MLKKTRVMMNEAFEKGYNSGYDRGLLDMQLKTMDTVLAVMFDADSKVFDDLCTALETEFKKLLWREEEP